MGDIVNLSSGLTRLGTVNKLPYPILKRIAWHLAEEHRQSGHVFGLLPLRPLRSSVASAVTGSIFHTCHVVGDGSAGGVVHVGRLMNPCVFVKLMESPRIRSHLRKVILDLQRRLQQSKEDHCQQAFSVMSAASPSVEILHLEVGFSRILPRLLPSDVSFTFQRLHTLSISTFHMPWLRVILKVAPVLRQLFIKGSIRWLERYLESYPDILMYVGPASRFAEDIGKICVVHVEDRRLPALLSKLNITVNVVVD